MHDQVTVQRRVSARLPTTYGDYRLVLYTTDVDHKEHLAIVMGDVNGDEPVLVRVHSECFTGDVLGSQRCDCGEQLNQALQLISAEGRGVVIYLRQEGRGIGLLEKLKAYNLQDNGFDTVEANLALGHPEDERDYHAAAAMLKDQGVKSVRLMTNNPDKIKDLQEDGIEVVERIGLQPTIYPDNLNYLVTKARRMNHLLDLHGLFIPGD